MLLKQKSTRGHNHCIKLSKTMDTRKKSEKTMILKAGKKTKDWKYPKRRSRQYITQTNIADAVIYLKLQIIDQILDNLEKIIK